MQRTPPWSRSSPSGGSVANKDLALDTSGVGQIFGLSEVIPLVTTYESHPIVRQMTGVATGFPLSRTTRREDRRADKWTPRNCLSTSENSYATTNLSANEIRDQSPKDKKGPLNLGAAASSGSSRVVVVGSSTWLANSFLASTAIATCF